MQHFSLIFTINLRDLGDRSVKDYILDGLSTDPRVKDLQYSRLNFLVILDGFDEIAHKSKVIKFLRDESLEISLQMTILVTTRPHVLEEIREDMTIWLSIEGFTRECQEKYIKIIFKDDEGKANEIFRKLNEDEFYAEIAQSPLMLHMLCCLHKNGEIVKLKTMADLHLTIFTLITERYVRKTNQKGKFKTGKYFVGENLLLDLVKKSSCSITSQDLKALFPKEDERNFVIGLDILTVDSFHPFDDIINYRFVHRTFGAFLSALSIYIRKFSSLSHIGNMELLFLFGFYKDKPLPKKILRAMENEMFDLQFMLRAHKQIKLKKNWERFCSLAKIVLHHRAHFIYFEELLKLYELKELYLCFHQTAVENEDRESYVSDIVKNWSLGNNCKIYLILSLHEALSDNLNDIREPVLRIINFIDVMSSINSNIDFIGVCYRKVFYLHDCFTNVNYNLNMSNIRKSLNLSEDEQLIALQCSNSERESITCILSLLQYETLLHRIKFQRISRSID
ncbi:uncharacterized protein LOC111623551 [Centruroides sculpturatus]|uniref:uncharacterized protein LOC111623551 n=1 Tax=Centruroides sculpturatus TaxID=218467 RepID=UPI000C6E94B0|nr:uncharacterized protein LOC111623551 [Centruroides sculpturatus]XP_023221934.1 uncharacterized protein LOC111623551 [Centruroides sculpturatus]